MTVPFGRRGSLMLGSSWAHPSTPQAAIDILRPSIEQLKLWSVDAAERALELRSPSAAGAFALFSRRSGLNGLERARRDLGMISRAHLDFVESPAGVRLDYRALVSPSVWLLIPIFLVLAAAAPALKGSWAPTDLAILLVPALLLAVIIAFGNLMVYERFESFLMRAYSHPGDAE